MTAPQYDLATIQRWMQSVISYPGGVTAGVETAAAQDQIAITAAEIEQVVNRSEKLDAVHRMEVYSGAYFARLLECMRGEFPVTQATVGEELFDQFVVGYLNTYPSRSYSLGHLGENFANYLAETSPRDEGQITQWAEFVIDLARLEWAFNEVFDGPGAEADPKLSPEQLRNVPADQWPDAKLAVVPSLRLMEFSHPVSQFFTAKRRDATTPIPDPQASFLAISRREYIVRRFDLNRAQFELLQCLVAGETVGDAIAQAAEFYEDDVQQFAADLGEWFRQWAAEQFFLRVELP
ncbi:hypothetical protein Pan258_38070 [Symmachiella dynata]|uniref:HvfC/BufC N-terminal domain-containing protein n=1 Tax=Symmachiella dynata TaxID=2527995 RepID=UPI001188234C|nr:DNA-binding domain-containing protein [Symmachiella dynata]QDT49752.1 hypothetical protein Pan258_38070 [Symmachiella dynata]